jgi:hypothetical protein
MSSATYPDNIHSHSSIQVYPRSVLKSLFAVRASAVQSDFTAPSQSKISTPVVWEDSERRILPSQKYVQRHLCQAKQERDGPYVRPRCQHGKKKSLCIDCGGFSLCGPGCKNHGRRKAFCVDCGGSALCCHGKPKRTCVKCGGSGICLHGKKRNICIECDGSGLCGKDCVNHGKRKTYCANCGGSGLCKEHSKRKDQCIQCKSCGPECVNHGKRKKFCAECGGSALCCHGNIKKKCIECNPVHHAQAKSTVRPLCPHGKHKRYCIECDGYRICSNCRDNPVRHRRELCRTCAPVPSNHARERESRMAAKLVKWAETDLIPIYTTWNRQNPMADPAQCGKYRPDFIYERPASVVVIEFDENQHRSYTLRCELARMAEVSLGYGGSPVHWVRYNPDSFRVNGAVAEPSEASRSSMLLTQMQWALDCVDYEHLITVTYICYSINSGRRSLSGAGMSYLVRRYRFKTVDDYTLWAEGRLAVCEG